MNSDTIFKILFWFVVIVIGMWLMEIGPFEKQVQNYQPSFTGIHETCRGNGCHCRIKQSELRAAGLNYCGCGHYIGWHYD